MTRELWIRIAKMFNTFGVRGRLLLSFVGISGFAVLGAVAAVYSFLQVQDVLDRVTEQRVPTALAAQQLSTRVERIVSETPTLLAASTTLERSEIWGKLEVDVQETDKLVLLLKSNSLPTDALTSLQDILDTLSANLVSLNELVRQLISLAEHKAVLLDEMHKAHKVTIAVLGPWITNISNNVQRQRATVENSKPSDEERFAIETELIESLTLLASLRQVSHEVTETQKNLTDLAFAEKRESLDLLKLRTQWSIESLNTLAHSVGAQPKQLVLAEVERFRRFFEGNDNVPQVRAEELALLANGEDLRLQNAKLSRELTKTVELLVRDTKLDIADATAQMHALQRGSSFTLIAIVLLSLLSSALIVWLYVDRNLIARLTALSNSMLAIADGNLLTQLPTAGTDEIGRMAEALVVFRDTAVEVEATNMREINDARERLTNAIESISEGFCLYDADDKLVICNSQYYQQFYPGMIDVLQPGTSFEMVIRSAAERGLVKEAHNYGSVDDWVVERLERHRNPTGSYIQHRAEQQWVQISERRTDDGGYVAVYTDITEIKDQEAQLAEKSKELELLSSQLAKYLSPQVYASIFSGKQEVKVTSSRKKLTVFFSDIVGFTETADRLESEELTRLLNHYLTEMSQIAQDFGATIDKYVGDAILIFFGDPETKGVKEDAIACVEMAIAMRLRLQALKDIWRQDGIERPLKCRMGIHTGFCTVGNFGSESRMDYTIIGSTVNTASRLESMATAGEILISYETFAYVKELIHCEEYGQVEVKGIAYPIGTYRVVDTYEALGRQRRHFREEHPAGKVELELDAMTTDERNQVSDMLRRAHALLYKGDIAGGEDMSPNSELKRKRPVGS